MSGDALLFEKAGDGVIKVRGGHRQLVGFLNRYWNALWPGWRESEAAETFVADLRRHEAQAVDKGVIPFIANNEKTRAAFIAAIR